MSKQDRQGVRTPADLERKYSFGQSFAQQGAQISRLEQELAQHEINANSAVSTLVKADTELQKSISENAKAIDAISESLQAGVGIWVVSIEITEV